MRLVFLGAPGSGKGTQAQRMMKARRIPQISTGDLLREAVANGIELGRKAAAAMKAGELVADEVVLAMIRDRLERPDTETGFILDGFPRNLAQAEALGVLLDEIGRPLQAAVLLNVEFDLLLRRLSGRRTCERCGHVFNIYTSPPAEDEVCDHCGGRLVQRPDDNEDTIRNRLEVYESQTAPLIDYYRQMGLLHEVDADGDVEDVFVRLEEELESLAS